MKIIKCIINMIFLILLILFTRFIVITSIALSDDYYGTHLIKYVNILYSSEAIVLYFLVSCLYYVVIKPMVEIKKTKDINKG